MVQGGITPAPFLTVTFVAPNSIRQEAAASPSIVTALIKGFDNIYGKFENLTAYLVRARRRIMYKLRERILGDPSQRWIDGLSDSALTTTTTTMAMAEIENVSNVDTAYDNKLGSPSVSIA